MIVHGGAGSGRFGPDDPRYNELRVAVEEGLSAMKRGSALEGVEAAVSRMEQSGFFNAGRGACLAADGSIQLDAAIMEGRGLKGAGVGAETATFSAVSMARWVMENTKHVLLVGPPTDDIARAAGLAVEELRPLERVAKKFSELLSEPKGRLGDNLRLLAKIQEGGTVGAVAVDSSGLPAAAVSTGGLWLKLPGRVGDSAVIGAGVYADAKTGAACSTGSGEEIIRNVLSWQACGFMRTQSAQASAKRAITTIARRSGPGTAGIITVDRKGRVGSAYNTEGMGRAWYDGKGKVRVVA